MTRKDSEKDAERPHYYSQFWLDIAAGRRVIGGPRPNEDGELIEPELSEVVPQRKVGRDEEVEHFSDSRMTDRRTDTVVHPVAEPIPAPDAFIEPDMDELEPLNNDVEEEFQDDPVEDIDIPDMDLSPIDEDEDEYSEEEDEEEDEDDVNWNRGRKKAKPVRPVKPVVKKPVKRDTRRNY